MAHVVVSDTSCLIDLHKGNLLMVLCRLPYRFVVPLPVRESEMLCLTNEEWDNFERSGAEIHDLPLERSEDVQALKEHHGRLSVNDCLYLVIVQRYDNGILLTGDKQLRKVAKEAGVRVHGVLWIVDVLKSANACEDTRLRSALEIWKSDKSVLLPDHLVDERLHNL